MRYGYNIYRRNEFKDELRECRSKDDLEGLFESLETVGTSLGVNIARERSMVEEALAELEENQAAYEDRMADQWKENRYHEQESDVELRDLFGSLMDDRS